MTQSLVELFGVGVNLTGVTLSINLTNFGKLNTPNPSATQIVAALLDFWTTSTQDLAEDETAGIVAASEVQRNFIVKNDVSLIEYNFSINAYVPDTSGAFDPDQVI